MGKNPHRVVVIGGGVAGLSTAHELAERGFEVEVYERRSYFGGKAASVSVGVENPHTTGPKGLPGEHGFRFFPGWYRHLPDTMKRIPYKDKTVHDNLVTADINLLVDYDRDPIRALVRFPTSWQELRTAAVFPAELMRLGLTADDLQFFFRKLWTFLTSSEERRMQEFDNQTWWEFMEADKRSAAFRDYLVVSATRNTVAAKPQEASAYTIAKVALQTLFDTFGTQTLFDRVLDGPTNEAWIDPWVDYLRGLGVRFNMDAELDSIGFDGPRITCVRFASRQRVRVAGARYALTTLLQQAAAEVVAELRGLEERIARCPSGADGPSYIETIDRVWPALDSGTPYGFFESKTKEAWRNERQEACAAAASLRLTYEARAAVLACLARRREQYEDVEARDRAAREAAADIADAETGQSVPVTADYYVFALPVEQMAYYVHRSETLKHYDPALGNVIRLSEHIDWMAGIQFYLRDVVNITRGHIDCLDSEWALTAISQVQFWKDFDLKSRGEGSHRGQVRSILSVVVSAWDRKGRLRPKEAFNCTAQEVAEEVWYQLKRSMNRPGRAEVLKDEMLLGWSRDKPAPPPESYYLDDSIVDTLDRRKQAVYDKFRTVRFSAAELIRKQRQRGTETEAAFMYGKRMQFNAEPLFISRVGSLPLRPTARREISNMFLAADYVRTHTNLATMEGANEAARAAVNEILLASGTREEPCAIWPLIEPLELFRKIDEVLFRKGQRFEDTYADIPVRLAAGAAGAASRLAAKALGKILTRDK